MRTIAILPVKSFGAAKQRLGGRVPGGARRALAQAMFADVLASLRRASAVDEIAVVSGDIDAQSAARANHVVSIDDTRDAGQSAAAELGIRRALAHDFERALLVPGDTPLISVADIDSLLGVAKARGSLTIVPDRHGEGTNALVLCPPDFVAPSFGPGSLERHVAAGREAGIEPRVERIESLALDVDTPEDLAALEELLERTRAAPRTRGALRQLRRAGLVGAPA